MLVIVVALVSVKWMCYECAPVHWRVVQTCFRK